MVEFYLERQQEGANTALLLLIHTPVSALKAVMIHHLGVGPGL